jgi:hypothetical protein
VAELGGGAASISNGSRIMETGFARRGLVLSLWRSGTGTIDAVSPEDRIVGLDTCQTN